MEWRVICCHLHTPAPFPFPFPKKLFFLLFLVRWCFFSWFRAMSSYSVSMQDSKPKLDKFGRPTAEHQIDSWVARRGIAAALIQIIPCLDGEAYLRDTMDFLLQNPCALRDEKAPVRHDMLQVQFQLFRRVKNIQLTCPLSEGKVINVHIPFPSTFNSGCSPLFQGMTHFSKI